MKKTFIFCLLLILLTAFSARSQDIFISLQANEQLQTDFYIEQLKDARTTKGGIDIPNMDHQVKFKLGFVNGIKSYFDQYLAFRPGKTPVIISIKQIEIMDDGGLETMVFNAGFFIRNGDMLVSLGNFQATSFLQSGNAKSYAESIKECLNTLIKNFNQTDWREKSIVKFIRQKAQKQLADESPGNMNVVNAQPSGRTTKEKKIEEQHRISLQSGYSYRFGDIPLGTEEKWEDFLMGLKNGFNLSLNYTFYFDHRFGVGLITNFMFLQNTYEDLPDTSLVNAYDYTEKINTGFIGPGIFVRANLIDERLQLNGYGTLGYMYYNNDVSWDRTITLTGSTIGLGLGLSFDLKISKNIYFNLGTNLFHGKLTTLEDGGFSYILLGEENIGHVDANAGISFIF